MIENADVSKEHHKIVHHHFDTSRGPLWAARLLPYCREQESFINKIKLDLPEDEEFSFICHILIAYHHSITDGFTCDQLIMHLLNLLEDVIINKAIDVTEQTSVLIQTEQEMDLINQIRSEFESKIRSFEERKLSHEQTLAECDLPKAYQVPVHNALETVCLNSSLDRKTTQLFLQKCKKEGITFNSGFTAATDAAYVKLLRDKNVEKDSYKITALHCVNNRRAYFTGADKSYGNGMGVLDTHVDTPKDVLDDFWYYSKKLHQQIKEQQKAMASYENYLIEQFTEKCVFEPISLEDIKKDSLPKIVTYASSNMLDVTKTFTNLTRKNIRLDWYDRLSSLQLMNVLWMSDFQTYHGQLMLSLQYNLGLMTSDTAQKLCDNIFEVIKQVVEE